MSTSPPVALTIAGSDNSAGAGIQADLKTFSTLEVYGLTTVTCVVSEIPGLVASVVPIPPKVIREQIDLSFQAFPVAAVKTGMLYSAEIIETVIDSLQNARQNGARFCLVVDPVMVASSGDALLQPEAIDLYRSKVIPMADLVTPNLDEAKVLLKADINNLTEMEGAGRELAQSYGTGFLLKGGHLQLDAAVDLLCLPDGSVSRFEASFVHGVSTHGTGCTYSAAITAHLARGQSLVEATASAKRFITRAISAHFAWRHADEPTHALNQLEG